MVLADSFLAEADKLRTKWRSQDLRIPAHSALDKLLDLFLGNPELSTVRAAEIIGKSYGATNEAMRQLVKVGIVMGDGGFDGRERIFVCRQSAAMITDFVEKLIEMGRQGGTERSALLVSPDRKRAAAIAALLHSGCLRGYLPCALCRAWRMRARHKHVSLSSPSRTCGDLRA